MIQPIIANLNKAVHLLENISEEVYRDKSIPPYYSSIGGHIRHILDVFKCVLEVEEADIINLVNRSRDVKVENYIHYALSYCSDVIDQLLGLSTEMLKKEITLKDDLGNGMCEVQMTFAAALVQAHSHAIHHYATIGYMIHHHGITLPDDCFGVNPTTPKKNALEEANK